MLRISSVSDPETGRPGKQVELVEIRRRGGQPFVAGASDEARVVQGILSQFQSMGIFPQLREMAIPKVTLFLSEEEYEALGIRFEVNDTYELVLKEGAITFRRATQIGISP